VELAHLQRKPSIIIDLSNLDWPIPHLSRQEAVATAAVLFKDQNEVEMRQLILSIGSAIKRRIGTGGRKVNVIASSVPFES
jgi:hypothetical protein